MKFFLQRIVSLLILSVIVLSSYAQNNFFSDAPETAFKNAAQKRVIVPGKYRTVSLASASILSFFGSLPTEKNIISRDITPILTIPMPDGTSARFHVWESAAMAPELAAANPGIKTFTGQGIDDPTATIKLDWTEFGFHAMILSPVSSTVFVDPYDQKTTSNYVSYYKKDYKKSIHYTEYAPKKFPGNVKRPATDNPLAGVCIGTQLRTYRLAVACTNQYAMAATGLTAPTQAQVLAKIVTSMNRVNGVYEKELSIRMVLIATENSVIFTTSAADPFTGNDDATVLINESQSVIDSRIGSANYDIGHTFSTGGGGLAGLGVVCQAGQKGSGITGSPSPVGDAYDIDFVAHEMGHQFGASHTFNSNSDNCSGNGVSTSNAEPGSGSTIMAYAGICGIDDLQLNSDAQFHAISLNEITAYVGSGGAGNTCAVVSATGNTAPVANAGADYIIPKSTPFSLTGSATDANGDALTYSWEQIDVGGTFGLWNSPSGNAPLFRSFTPKTTPVRFFPKLPDVIGNTVTIGELLPAYARTMHFRLTARDNRAGGGGVCFDENAITVNGTAGPFVVTAPNTSGITWLVNDFATITWDPSGTAAAPISCANVKIELSTDGGNTFPVTILASTPNDGRQEIQVPNNVTSSARIRITGVGNIFYDMSNANFAIQAASSQFTFNIPVPVATCGSTSEAVDLKTASLAGFTTTINLSASGNPAGTTVSFSSTTLTPGGTTTVTLNNTGGLTNGIYNVTVTGVAGSVTRTRIIPFEINTMPVAPATLSAPARGATGVSATPSLNWTPVAGAASYTLEFSTTSSFANIIRTVNNITTLPAVLTSALTENTLYYWRVTAINSCGVSQPSTASFFKTGIATCKVSTDPPQAISEDGTPTITSTITIPAIAGVTINDLNIPGFTATHSYANDLRVSLTSPAGTTVVLFDTICPSGAENLNFNFDDEATLAIPCPPPTSYVTVKPQNPLSAFDGENSAGVWTLTVTDNADQDGGTLTGWGIAFNNCAVIASPIASQLCPPSASTSFTSDVTGASYQWQVNMGSGFTNITNNANYSGATTATLQINNAPSSWNGYQYRCAVGENNSSVETIGFTDFWTGSVSSTWENPANWSCNSIPDANTDVVIASGTVVINSNATCRSITASPASSVTVNTGFKITVTH